MHTVSLNNVVSCRCFYYSAILVFLNKACCTTYYQLYHCLHIGKQGLQIKQCENIITKGKQKRFTCDVSLQGNIIHT